MSLDRVPGQHFGALVDHADGQQGPFCTSVWQALVLGGGLTIVSPPQHLNGAFRA